MSYGDLDMTSLIAMLTEQTRAAKDGDRTRAEAMLTAQAHTLDAIFNTPAQRAINTEYIKQLDCHLKPVLRARSWCRATLEALEAIKNPPMMGYVRQANRAVESALIGSLGQLRKFDAHRFGGSFHLEADLG